uniref:MARVEL domain-containing protein n=1 Tax=Globodera pallida TaxID=36090 RepID=A0A183BVM3_GLOPA
MVQTTTKVAEPAVVAASALKRALMYVAAIVLSVLHMLEAIDWFFGLSSSPSSWLGMLSVIKVCICLLVVYGQKECNPWLFVPCLILGVMEILARVTFTFEGYICVFHKSAKDYEGFDREYNRELCIFFLVYYAVSFLLSVWFYSIIVRGFSALREVESRRYRPHF